MITLQKEFTRYEWQLFWCYLWDYSDRVVWKEWLGVGVDNLLFLRPPDRNAITVWYDPHEYSPDGLDKFDAAVAERMACDPGWVDFVVTTFTATWERLRPYLRPGAELKSWGELRDYYQAWQGWWTPMAVVFVVPNVSVVPRPVRRRLLQLREKTQEYSDTGGGIIADFLGRHDQRLQAVWPFMSPEEVLLAERRLGDSAWYAAIERRAGGFGLWNGQLYLYRELHSVMARRGVRLAEGAVTSEGLAALKGSPASPGVVRGLVKVVVSYRAVGAVAAGAVLVTEMTTPEFVPAMKRAAAIVTDEGGITCHAAIVSRELHKPCVIGTKIATRVLKDGDEVEVDADVGVVRVLKRA